MSDFPLCSELGLELLAGGKPEMHGRANCFISAADVERLLSAGVSLELIETCKMNAKQYWRTVDINDVNGGTHSAIAIIRPIVRDTAESLLRELIEWSDSTRRQCLGDTGVVERARVLLRSSGEGGGK